MTCATFYPLSSSVFVRPEPAMLGLRLVLLSHVERFHFHNAYVRPHQEQNTNIERIEVEHLSQISMEGTGETVGVTPTPFIPPIHVLLNQLLQKNLCFPLFSAFASLISTIRHPVLQKNRKVRKALI